MNIFTPRHPKYQHAEKAVRDVFNHFRSHADLSAVMTKVCVLNSLYATAIYSIVGMAEHIYNIRDIDNRLSAADLTLVDEIRHGHNINTKKKSKEIDFYSFATKYCSFHNDVGYPIFDNLVSDLLFQANKIHKWYPSLRKEQLRNYHKFVPLVDAYATAMGVAANGYKSIDKGLWILSKYWFRNRSNVEDPWITAKLSNALS